MRPRGTRGASVGAAAGAAFVALAAAGCGSDQADYANEPRPASPITVTAAISDDRIRVSPATFGAGPVTIIVSNQSGAPQQITFETDEVAGDQSGIRKSAGPVNDSDTAQLQVDPREGTYRLAVEEGGIEPAQLEVGAPRKSGQDDLLLP